MVHCPDVASWFDGDRVAGVDLAGLDRVFALADLVCVDGSRGVNRPGVLCQFENFLRSLRYLEFAAVLDCVGVCQVE